MYYGNPRFTKDIDLVVNIEAVQVADFPNQFPSGEYYCPPIEIIQDEILRRGSFNLIHHETSIKIDIVVNKNSDFYKSEFERAKKSRDCPRVRS
jgi:hypothetical protein